MQRVPVGVERRSVPPARPLRLHGEHCSSPAACGEAPYLAADQALAAATGLREAISLPSNAERVAWLLDSVSSASVHCSQWD
jgi:hypothetical protein